MITASHIILIDADVRRRAAITHLLGAEGVHVEPFEDTVEAAAANLARADAVLIEDGGRVVPGLVAQIAGREVWLPVIAYSEEPQVARVVDAVREGAADYLSWPFTAEQLQTTLAVARGRSDDVSNDRLRKARARGRIEKLTKREREVLAGVAKGLSNRKIGERLEISPRTVEIHRANMLNKMGAEHTSDAIRIAVEASLVA
jgi:two-component system, LuxR family, response regulator FixJ